MHIKARQSSVSEQAGEEATPFTFGQTRKLIAGQPVCTFCSTEGSIAELLHPRQRLGCNIFKV